METTASPTPSGMSGNRKRVLVVAGVALVAGFLQYQFNVIPTKALMKAVVPQSVELNTSDGPTTKSVTNVALGPACGSQLASVSGPTTRINIWAWNAQMALIGANCGPKTMRGSMMEKYGVKLLINRQDDTEKSKPEQIKFAQLLANGDPNPGEGIQFVVIMGDGASQYLADVNKKLIKLGPDYKAEIVGSVGYSGNKLSGEDTFMGPAEWKEDPQKARGALCSGVLRDGDWNIAQAWLNTNGIPNNPDDRYIDPNAVNWVNADDYLKAAEMYVTGYHEDRKIVVNGQVTNQPKQTAVVICSVTWTPGDVNIAKKRGGLVKLLSTKENRYQMPAVLIGIHKWDNAHSKIVEGMLQATFETADQINAYPEALTRAGKASYAVYAEETPAYWVKYYRGVVERDATGQPIPLGGSRVSNLGDNLFLFGLVDGGAGIEASPFSASYEGFGKVIQSQYPTILPKFPSASEATNLTFLTNLATKMNPSKPETTTFEQVDSISPENVVAKRNVTIEFDSGQATIKPSSVATLENLFTQLSVGAALSVEIDGHTDNTGSPSVNLPLSEARANAVKLYLETKNRALFPANRVITRGFGDTKPISDNSTNDGRARNRRVVIILGSTE